MEPNRSYTLKSGGTCTINNVGFRGTSRVDARPKPATFRVVILGESAAFSYDVDDKDTWAALVEDGLEKEFPDSIEVINAAVPGYSVFDSKINYLYQIRRLSPDAVVVYHTWNDMKYFKALDEGLPLFKGVASADRVKSTLRHVQVAWRVRNFYHQFILPRRRENTYGDSLSSTAVRIQDRGPAHQWERQNYRDLAQLLKSDGVLPIFVSQASLLSSYNLRDPAIRAVIYAEYQGLSMEEILRQWEATTRIIAEAAEEGDAIFVDAFSRCPRDLEHFYDHVHLTERGNEAVARIIVDELRRNERFREAVSQVRASHRESSNYPGPDMPSLTVH
jgi:lysophospholipase L1-like esterase